MLVPQAALAVLCLGLGIFPGLVLATLDPVVRSLPGFAPVPDVSGGTLAMVSGLETFDRVGARHLRYRAARWESPAALCYLTWHRWATTRRVPTWGCGGELTAQAPSTPPRRSRSP